MDNAASIRLIALYRKRAKRYDWATLLLYLVGFRHRAYRKRAIHSLALRQGETVVELGCGTGLNFALLQKQISPGGRIIGVDLTDAMLDGVVAASHRLAGQTSNWSRAMSRLMLFHQSSTEFSRPLH